MRQGLSILSTFVVLFSIAGCRGGKELVLYHPGEIKSWETVEKKAESAERPRIELQTTMGSITIELFEEEAPLTVANILRYVEEGFYEGTIFHRIIPGMIVQGGGFTADMEQKETHDPVKNEATNGIRNLRGTVGLARTSVMDSGTSQFFINLVDNTGFNGDGITGGYAVFGRVYDGMDIVDSMSIVETTTKNRMRDVPVEPIVILSAKRLQ